MHWCPDYYNPCYCDLDDTDFGVRYCDSHIGCLEEREDFENEDLAKDDEEWNTGFTYITWYDPSSPLDAIQGHKRPWWARGVLYKLWKDYISKKIEVKII